MKISKVDHRKTAVGMLQEDGMRGIIYKDPSQGKETEDLEWLVKDRNSKSGNLYSVLNSNATLFSNKRDKDKQRTVSMVINNFSFIFKGIFKNNQGKYQKGYQKQYNAGIKLDDYNAVSSYIKENTRKVNTSFLGYESHEKLAQDIVAAALRNSLRKKITWHGKEYYLPGIATKLLLATIINDDIKEYERIPEEEVLAFVAYVDMDKNNNKTRTDGDKIITSQQDVVASIKKQDVKVQVFDKDGEKMLMLSNSTHPRKRYIADFIKNFAGCTNEAVQDKMIFNIRRLIVLYVYGPLQYDTFQMDNPWGRMPDFDGKNNTFGYTIQKDTEGKIYYEEVITCDMFNNDDNKKNSRTRHLEFDRKIRDVIISHYKAAEEKILNDMAVTNKEDSLFWIHYFEESVEKFVKIRKKREKDNYMCGRICNKLWEEWFSYIAMKYIDLGKAVYYFGTPDLYNTSLDKPVKIGPVLEQYKNGITSFDYEKTKAEETLVRNFATVATFAGSTFSNAVVKQEYRSSYSKSKNGRKTDNSDVLGYPDKIFSNKEAVKDNAVQCALGYFSCAGLWDNIKIKDNDEARFLAEIKKHIARVRNTSFHFSTDRNVKNAENNIYVQRLFNSEYSKVKRLTGEKYISNNTVVFYPADNNGAGLYALIKELYSAKTGREAQIPAFNNIIKKKDMRVFVESFLLKNNIEARKFIFSDIQLTDRYLSSLYFLLKEIYYYGFLAGKNMMQAFNTALRQIENDVNKENEILRQRQKNTKKIKDTKQKQAMSNFIKRYNEIAGRTNDKITFGQLCQQIMTDYNMQNQKQKEILSTDREKQNQKNGNKPIYKHYVLILQQCIRKMFENYLSGNEVFSFLKSPQISRNGFDTDILSQEKAEEFINGMPEIGMFNSLSILGNGTAGGNAGTGQDIQLMYDWYITAHFTSARQINMLAGDIRSYKQYVTKIHERAKNTGNTDAANRIINDSQIHRYLDVLEVLEFVIQFTGRTSKEIKTYFATDEEYAKYISNYVDFDEYLGNAVTDKYKNGLQAFCGQMVADAKSTDKALGIYYDARNPVPNKNVIYSLLYGDTPMLSAVMKENKFRINKKEISDYYKRRNELEEVFKRGRCVTSKEQEKLKEFQNIKNRIELLDIKEYTELVNDIMSQMVSWAYLRERDLMYFQLGYHYTRLFYTGQVTETRYNVLKSDRINIEKGALLYQIIALYNHELPVYRTDEDGNATEKPAAGTTGACIGPFVKDYCKENMEDPYTYYGGIRFFEDRGRHDDFTGLRNYIAHMKYYSFHDKSIWDLFGEMYNGFLIYDTKLKKSVSYISGNILEKYFVVVKTVMSHNGKDNNGFKFAAEEFKSDKFTYKYKDKNNKENKVEVPCRSNKFLEQVEKILEYKKKVEK